jgi:hypothetical protein
MADSQQAAIRNGKMLVTKTSPDPQKQPTTLKDIGAAVYQHYLDYAKEREELEEYWTQCWSTYIGTPASERLTEERKRIVLGDVRTNWRHKVNTGKGFEVAETINAYLQSATFPNNDWFRMDPLQPGIQEFGPPLTQFLKKKLEVNDFQSHWDTHCRQCIITGTSVMALPWRIETSAQVEKVEVDEPQLGLLSENNGQDAYKTVTKERVKINAPDFEVLDMFDVYIDATATNPANANIVRKIHKTCAEVVSLIKQGYYDTGSVEEVLRHAAYENSQGGMLSHSQNFRQDVYYYHGLNYDPHYQFELLEFSGDLHLPDRTYHDVIVTVLNNHVLRFKQNPYEYGKPYSVLTFVPSPRS